MGSDGSIIVVGWTPDYDFEPHDPEFAAVRLTASGLLDTSFGNQGIWKHDVKDNFPVFHGPNFVESEAQRVTFLPDGSYVINGTAFTPGYHNPPFFGVTIHLSPLGDEYTVGLQTRHGDFQHQFGFFPAVAVQPDGKYFNNDSSYHGIQTGFDVDVTRYNIDGTVDGTFGIGGVSSVDFGSFLDSKNSSSIYQFSSSIAVNPTAT